MFGLHVKTAFSRDLVGLLGYERDRVGLHVERDFSISSVAAISRFR